MRIRLTTFLCAICAIVFAQDKERQLQEADQEFLQQRYAEALPKFKEQLLITSSNANIFYKAGICYLRSRSQKDKAPALLEKAIENSTSFYTKGYAKETDAPIDAFLYLGDAYHVNYDFEKAIDSYNKYKEMLRSSKIKDLEKYTEADARIEASAFANELKKTVGFPPNLNLRNLGGGESIGVQTAELTPDNTTMIYTLRIPVDKLSRYGDERYFKVITPEPEKKEVRISKPSRSKNDITPDTIVNICTVGTSVDGQVLLTYHNEKGDCNLYIIRLKDNKWTTPARLPKTANDKGWEPGEFISADGRYLFFVSDRAGGYGGKDIYRCEKLKDGQWSRAENLGPAINTPYDEEAPFLHVDGESLYFSSNRFKPAMSYDILVSKHSAEGWSEPRVVGYPINSSEGDIFYQVSGNKKNMIASASPSAIATEEMNGRPAKKLLSDKKKRDRDKNSETASAGSGFLMSFENQAKSSLTMLTGEVMNVNKKASTPLSATITVIDLKSEVEAGRFFSEREKGQYTFILPAGRNTGIWYEAPGFLFASENQMVATDKTYFQKRQPVILPLLEEGATTILNNIFFKENSSEILPESGTELNRIYEFMKSHPEINVRINNYIYSKDKAFRSLSSQRAETIAKALEEKGIDKKRLKHKGFRKSEQPGLDKKKGPLKPEDLKPVQKAELEITEVKS